MTRSPSPYEEAARRLAAGDALGALKRVSLSDDPSALALRGIAMAQLGDLLRARSLLADAAAQFDEDPVGRARCVVAEAEVALAMRDLSVSRDTLRQAIAALDDHGDLLNVNYGRLVLARFAILIGDLDEAREHLERDLPKSIPSHHAAVFRLLRAESMIRAVRVREAEHELRLAFDSASASGISALVAEVRSATDLLDRCAARAVDGTGTHERSLREVEAILSTECLVVDGCRRRLIFKDRMVSFVGRPTPMALLIALATAGPDGVDRETLIAEVFDASKQNDSHRARLRVDLSRLRKVTQEFVTIEATATGYRLVADAGVVVLLPPIEGDHASIVALLADGVAWSTSALAAATGTSQRTVQRSLAALTEEGRVTSYGRGPTRRWLSPPLTKVTTSLLLPPT